MARVGWVARPGSSNGSGGIGGEGREARRGLGNGSGVVGGEGREARTGGLGSEFGVLGGEGREARRRLGNGSDGIEGDGCAGVWGASLCIDRLLGQKVARGVLGAGDPSLIPSLGGDRSVGGVLV